MNEPLLIELNQKLDRLLAVLDPKPDRDALYRFCVAEAARGNFKPIEQYMKRANNGG
jgi:hypothetical protein